MQTIKVDPLLRKVEFAQARGLSARTVDRYVKLGLIPEGEIVDAGGTRAWRASLANKPLAELTAIAQAQASESAAAEREAIADRMRDLGAKGGRRKRGRPRKAQPAAQPAAAGTEAAT
jgi:hypothetical protein